MKLGNVNCYILKLLDGRFYCGITNNIERRYKEHSEGLKSWASKIGVVQIVYIVKFDNRKQAARQERKIKLFGCSKFIKYFRVHNKYKF